MNTVLLIRDQQACDALRGMLERENLNPIPVRDAERGLEEALTRKPHLLLVDMPLDGVSSGEVLRRAAGARTPMIVMSTVDDEEEKSILLDQGAEDYILKPFSERELLARIRAILRRTAGQRESAARFGEVEVNFERRVVTRNGREVQICLAEYKLLVFFLKNPGRALTREEILDRVWGQVSSNTRTLDMHVARLRSKLEVNPNVPQHILTIHGVGYRFLA